VHPSWHNTAILGGEANVKRLNKAGIFPDPASNVSDAVIEQVLANRSGQIFVPKGENGIAMTRSWPLWLQDVVGASLRRAMKAQASGNTE
jgi:hypothetical protein